MSEVNGVFIQCGCILEGLISKSMTNQVVAHLSLGFFAFIVVSLYFGLIR